MGKNKKKKMFNQKKTVDVSALKHKMTQEEFINMISDFRTHINKHFETVRFKAKNLIDTRWKEGTNGGT